jgi:hypothetical protein
MQAFSNILEGHLPKVGLHCENGLALYLGEWWTSEGARELKVGKGRSRVLVLVHFVGFGLYGAS